MDFYLRYRGPLPTCSRSDARVDEKHAIRTALSPQLQELWAQIPQLEHIRDNIDKLPKRTIKGRTVEVPRPIQSPIDFFYDVQFRNCLFTPLITRPLELLSQLDIQFLRRENPGAILQGGDLDNRLKTLFDGLRIPQNDDEVPTSVLAGQRWFCLMEDDSLVTRINIETGRLWGPLEGKERESDVDLSIHVTVKLGWPMMANLSWAS